jgi:Ca2+-binding EF-hand superfamily protein
MRPAGFTDAGATTQTINTKLTILMKTLLTTLAAATVAVTFAYAEDKPAADAAKPKKDPAEVFKKMDANSDGSVTLEEFKAVGMGKKDPAKGEALFKKKDKDADGKLSLEEYTAQPAKKQS